MNTFSFLYSIISKFDKIAIFGHGYPDGDCYGSQIGLREILRAAFPLKDIRAVGSGLECLLDRVSKMDDYDEAFLKGSLGILVDVSCLRRVEDQRVNLCSSWIKFDHHELNEENESFPYPYYCDPRRVSCAEIITEFGKELNLSFNRVAAEALLSGILTDSGRLVFPGVCQKTFDDCEFLKSHGANKDELIPLLYSLSEKQMKYQEWMKSHADQVGKVNCLFAYKKDYEAFGLSYDEAWPFVNVLLEGGSIMALYCCERDDKFVRVEMRSKVGYPIQPVAKAFNGGGHLYAAGCEIYEYEDRKKKYEAMIDALNSVELVK